MESARPSVDVVVPFSGPVASLTELVRRLGGLGTRGGDTVTVVDNRPAGEDVAGTADVRVVRARERRSSYYARNRGAAGGSGDWLLFLDSDVEAPADLLEAYFRAPVGERVGVLAGAVRDEEVGDASGVAARWATLRGPMSQQHTLEAGGRAYAQTANCAIRRAAFEEVRGFRDDIRSGGDADICWRLSAAGWTIEGSDAAAVIHRSRRTLRHLVRQHARHGSGAGWLDREYPGSLPRRENWPGLALWALRSLAAACVHAVRGRRDEAIVAAIDPLTIWAFELGRLIPNGAGGDGSAACAG